MPLPDLATAPAGIDSDDWTAACNIVRSYCRWHIAPSVVDDVTTLESSDLTTDSAFLPTMYLTAVSEISNDGTVVTAKDIRRNGVITRGDGWRWSETLDGVQITYTHGYPQCPEAVLAVAKDIAQARGGSSRVGLKSRAAGPFREEYTDEYLTDEQRIALDPYRIPDL